MYICVCCCVLSCCNCLSLSLHLSGWLWCKSWKPPAVARWGARGFLEVSLCQPMLMELLCYILCMFSKCLCLIWLTALVVMILWKLSPHCQVSIFLCNTLSYFYWLLLAVLVRKETLIAINIIIRFWFLVINITVDQKRYVSLFVIRHT